MGVYHQMGHDSENLVGVPELSSFAGAILSPVNYTFEEISQQVTAFGKKPGFDLLFDPQLYDPSSDRENLRKWRYFPTELETADLSSLEWWSTVNSKLLQTVGELGCKGLCSPAPIPRSYSSAYYDTMTAVASDLADAGRSSGIKVVQTVLIDLEEIADPAKVMALSSIISRTTCAGIYLVFVGETEPRRELDDTESLKGAMRLVQQIEQTGIPVTVGFSSTDLLLWKSAGATNCATGKFFNLRRFTKSRFKEPEGGGGGQLPYWIEESLVAFLRESDVVRIQKQQMFSEASNRNPFAVKILEQFAASPGKAWLAICWRQYLWWFADIEARLASDRSVAKTLLREAERNWEALEDKDVFMEESRNDGRWLRAWRRALAEYGKDD
jgi:hypothetical protein